MSVRIKPLTGHGVQGGGLVWRYRDENNYYLARANVQERTVTVYKVQNGRTTLLMPGAQRDIPANSWSTLKVSARANRFQVFMDHPARPAGMGQYFPRSGQSGSVVGRRRGHLFRRLSRVPEIAHSFRSAAMGSIRMARRAGM